MQPFIWGVSLSGLFCSVLFFLLFRRSFAAENFNSVSRVKRYVKRYNSAVKALEKLNRSYEVQDLGFEHLSQIQLEQAAADMKMVMAQLQEQISQASTYVNKSCDRVHLDYRYEGKKAQVEPDNQEAQYEDAARANPKQAKQALADQFQDAFDLSLMQIQDNKIYVVKIATDPRSRNLTAVGWVTMAGVQLKQQLEALERETKRMFGTAPVLNAHFLFIEEAVWNAN